MAVSKKRRETTPQPVGAVESRKILDSHPLCFDVFRRERQLAASRAAMECDSDCLHLRLPAIEVERVEGSDYLDFQARFLPSFSNDRLQGRLSLPHPAAPDFPLPGGVVLRHASPEQQYPVVSLDEESDNYQEFPVIVRDHVDTIAGSLYTTGSAALTRHDVQGS